MHYHAEVWLPEASNLEERLEFVMGPHQEAYDDEADSSTGFWDWYQVGGRWTGEHFPDYDPNKDPANIETCSLCQGTGFRRDLVGREARLNDRTYTCNSCGTFDREKKVWTHGEAGLGKCVKWPTSWAFFEGDVVKVKDAPVDLDCFTLLVNDQVFSKTIWDGGDFKETGFDGKVLSKLKELGVKDGVLVTVDYHC